MKPKVLITQKIPEIAYQTLKETFSVDILDKNITFDLLSYYCQNNNNIYALLTLLTDKVGKAIIDIFPKSLKVISNFAVGFNNIDIDECNKKGILVTNTPDVLTDSTADLTMALLLSSSRRIIEGHNYILANKFSGWDHNLLLGSELFGKTLGIIGLGRIGEAVAKRAKAFGLEIIYYNRSEKTNCEYRYKNLKDLLKESDFISIHTPLNNDSNHLITKKEFSIMKGSAYLINTSRGSCINEKDLAEALKTKQIKGAAIDVFEFEPKVTEGLKKLDNIVMTPHLGSSTKETRFKMAKLSAENILNSYLNQGKVHRVN